MELFVHAGLWIGALQSVALCILIFKLRKETTVGTIFIDQSDPEEPYMFFESNISVKDLSKYKKAKINIVTKNFLQN